MKMVVSLAPRKADMCEQDEVFIFRKCVNFFDNNICAFGERLYKNSNGVCHCDEGFGRLDDKCYEYGTIGPCEKNKYFQNEKQGCKVNPCGDSTKSLPREDESEECLFDPDQCTPYKCVQNDKKTISVVPGGRQKCGRRRVWSTFRGKCVKAFF